MSAQGDFFQDPPEVPVGRVVDGSTPIRYPIAGTDRTLPSWLGLVTSHRRLFDASQDGWLLPPSRSCFLLGPESFVSEGFSAGRNVIPIRLEFAVDKLPFPDARKHLERSSAGNNGNDDGGEPPVVHWPAPIPLYAVKKVRVPSAEQRTRLLAMAGQLSNVSLPVPEVEVGDFTVSCPATGVPATPEPRSLELPGALNAIQGAMAMAVWAVPRVEPWIEVLEQAMDRNAARVAEGTRRLDARWLQLPWFAHDRSRPARDDAGDQEGLWRAALSCMQWRSAAEGKSPGALAEEIAQAASIDGPSRTAEMWLARTRRIIETEETVACDDWRRNGAGLAIRLALLRPEPVTFKSWSRDLPGLPPAVWWAAATLCGWRHGYRALDKRFRGDTTAQEFLATRALAASWPSDDSEALLASQQSSLQQTRENGFFTLTWCGHPVVRKPWHSRAKWYGADLTNNTMSKAAQDLADRLGWPCLERRLPLPEGRVRAAGSGHLSVDGDALVVEGERSLRLPRDIDIDERFDAQEFRRRLAIEAGVVPDPPEVSGRQPEQEVPGLVYKPDFITEEEETRLGACIDAAEGSTELQRRVQHYGWRYDYKQRRIDETMRLGELPEWARELGRKLVNEELMTDLPDQVIVNEYRGKQGISRHVDQPRSFAEHVATISLVETWGMVFRLLRGSKEKKVEKPLERRSVAVLTGDARYKWKHEIPNRANEPRMEQGKRRWVPRNRRISLTFRKVRPERNA